MKEKNEGFTLVELMIVVAILGILAVALVPKYLQYVDRSREQAAMTECSNCVKITNIMIQAGEIDTLPVAVADGELRNKIGEKANVSGVVRETTLSDKDVTQLKYVSAGNITVVYENGEYSVKDAG
ncbi:MAG: prepilin-type N-terminal cleavage/methylation domain-containing protein [Clostridia bacterium]|nr:prepilin-type N-terminal cleavage/methylation domain-containing protein [Clostridia bacterium]